MSKHCPNCAKQHTDCFAYSNGRCTILCNTDFEGKDCPFFKTKEQCARGNRQRRERLSQQGIGHLLGKYGG